MTDYSKMSYLQINNAVAEIVKPNSPVDYLSSWRDSDPIFAENKITIMPVSLFLDVDEWNSYAGEGDVYRCRDKNPLRAAMIVFLMMKDAENAPAI